MMASRLSDTGRLAAVAAIAGWLGRAAIAGWLGRDGAVGVHVGTPWLWSALVAVERSEVLLPLVAICSCGMNIHSARRTQADFSRLSDSVGVKRFVGDQLRRFMTAHSAR